MDLRAQLQQHLGTAYDIQRELGGGGMSRVFLAVERRLGRTVVIKVLSPDLAQTLNADRFEREIRVAASLQQANIVPLLVAGEVSGIPWFTMPYVEGESLRARLARGPVSVSETIAILRDVSRALGYAHAHGVVHRDIKPDNVLLSGGTAVVTDFGIAKAITASRTGAGDGATLTQLGTALGTPAYMAPEQVAGDPDIDSRVDLYALGCMAYELLTGRQPFADRTPQRVLAAHLSETMPAVTTLRADCPPALAQLIRRLTEKDPADRPQSAEEVLAALESVSTPTGTGLAFAPAGMLRRALLVYGVALLAVAVVARAAVIAIGLPDWVFPGAIVVMAFGLPALLLTAYVQRVARHAATATPTLTPGGTSVARAPSGTVATIALKASPHLTWRRTGRWGAYAMGAFAVVVAVFMGLRAAGIGPWGSLFAAGKLSRNDRIVLADLSVAPGDSALLPILGAAVRASLSQSSSIRLVEPAEIAGVLDQMKRPRDIPFDPDVAREVAVRDGAQAVLGGHLASVGNGYVVSLDLADAQTGATLASVQGTADGPKDLLDVVDRLTRTLRGRIGESLKQVQAAVPLARATTSSLEALRKYSEAVQANDVDLDYPRAVRAAREAVGLDSTFALAWRKLAIALTSAGGAPAEIDSALANAARYADRLPDREKYLALGAYYRNYRSAADRGKALAAYQAAYAADSTSSVAANQLAGIYGERGQYDSALRYMGRESQLQNSTATDAALVNALLFAEGADSASRAWAALVGRNPEAGRTWVAQATRAELAVAREDRAGLAVILDSMRSSPNARAQLAGVQFSLIEAAAGGKAAAADRYLAELDRLQLASSGVAQFNSANAAALDVLFRGDSGRAIRHLDSVLASPAWVASAPENRPYVTVASLYAMAGRPKQARQLLDAARAAVPYMKAPDAQPVIAETEGDIALAEGRVQDAVRLYRMGAVGPDGAPVGCPACLDYQLGHAFDRAGDPDSALSYFEQYLAVPPIQRLGGLASVSLPLVERRLAELYDGRHQNEKAMEHYTAFVDLWKNADADLQPQVKAAKQRLAELASQ